MLQRKEHYLQDGFKGLNLNAGDCNTLSVCPAHQRLTVRVQYLSKQPAISQPA